MVSLFLAKNGESNFVGLSIHFLTQPPLACTKCHAKLYSGSFYNEPIRSVLVMYYGVLYKWLAFVFTRRRFLTFYVNSIFWIGILFVRAYKIHGNEANANQDRAKK